MKKIGGIEEDVILTAGLVLGGYLLIKNFLPDLFPSLGVSAADKATLDAQQTTPDEQNVFNNSYPSAAQYATNNIDWSHYDNSADFYNALYSQFVAGNLQPTSPFYTIMQIYYALYKALIGHVFDADQGGVNAALNLITNKYQLGIIQEIFADVNGQDLWKLLRQGQWSEIYGLNGTDLAAQVTRLNNLPE
jgi:hypothetical protein